MSKILKCDRCDIEQPSENTHLWFFIEINENTDLEVYGRTNPTGKYDICSDCIDDVMSVIINKKGRA